MTGRSISFVDLGDLTVRLAMSGHGSPLLFLNGSGQGATIEAVSAVLDRFDEHFRVACHDQRGLGQSGVPDGAWTMADYAADAFALADHLGWPTFDVVGVSFGGMVALEMAAIDPARLRRIVVWGATPGGAVPSYPLHELASMPADERANVLARLLDNRTTGAPAQASPGPGLRVRARGRLGALRRRITTRRGPSGSGPEATRHRGLASQIEARRRHDVQGRLGDVTSPTLVGAGEFDDLAPAANVRAIVDEIPHARFRCYPSGHFFFLSDEALSDAVAFLSASDEEARRQGPPLPS